jgi:hypothetical protein
MQPRSVRISEATFKQISEAAKRTGYPSASALIRDVLDRETAGGRESAEERVASTLDQIRRDLNSLGKTLNALFAFTDTLAKVVMRTLPEPNSASVARARKLYEQFLKQASSAMDSGTPAALRNGGEQ